MAFEEGIGAAVAEGHGGDFEGDLGGVGSGAAYTGVVAACEASVADEGGPSVLKDLVGEGAGCAELEVALAYVALEGAAGYEGRGNRGEAAQLGLGNCYDFVARACRAAPRAMAACSLET